MQYKMIKYERSHYKISTILIENKNSALWLAFNIIECLWREMKVDWLKPCGYAYFDTLFYVVNQICIDFVDA